MDLTVTGTTKVYIEQTGLIIDKKLSSCSDAQIGAIAVEDKLDKIIFFRNQLEKHQWNLMCKC
ncbi:MAG: hypothetical protein H7098_01025 [Oligoflexus sp.]|nr:hypothetical protein [Pseudopedobacter sp.]